MEKDKEQKEVVEAPADPRASGASDSSEVEEPAKVETAGDVSEQASDANEPAKIETASDASEPAKVEQAGDASERREGTGRNETGDDEGEGAEQEVFHDTEEYLAKLEEARSRDFSVLEAANFLRIKKVPRRRPVVTFDYVTFRKVDPKYTDTDEVFLYFIYKMDSVAGKHYTFVFIRTSTVGDSDIPATKLFSFYKSLPRKYKKNLKRLIILHPTFWIRVTKTLFQNFLSPKFWKKLYLIDHLDMLQNYIDARLIELPAESYMHEGLTPPKWVSSDTSVFGVPFDILEEREGKIFNLHNEPLVPYLCYTYYKENPKEVKSEGIFRVPGSSATISRMEKVLNSGDFDPEHSLASIMKKKDIDITVHDVSSLLKKFFRDVPDSIFTEEARHLLVKQARRSNQPMKTAKLFVKLLKEKLPAFRANGIIRLFKILDLVRNQKESNLMNEENLAKIFSQVLFGPSDNLEDISEISRVTHQLISKSKYIIKNFPDKEEKKEEE